MSTILVASTSPGGAAVVATRTGCAGAGNLGIRRGRSNGSVISASATPAALANGMQGVVVGVGDGVVSTFLPGLVAAAPGQRPSSDPTPGYAGRRGGESTRAREAREARQRDHLDRVRDNQRKRESDQEQERQRQRGLEEMQCMLLGGTSLTGPLAVAQAGLGQVTPVPTPTSAAVGKVGRHGAVGTRHLARGQLRPLNRTFSEGLALNLAPHLYETSLS